MSLTFDPRLKELLKDIFPPEPPSSFATVTEDAEYHRQWHRAVTQMQKCQVGINRGYFTFEELKRALEVNRAIYDIILTPEDF